MARWSPFVGGFVGRPHAIYHHNKIWTWRYSVRKSNAVGGGKGRGWCPTTGPLLLLPAGGGAAAAEEAAAAVGDGAGRGVAAGAVAETSVVVEGVVGVWSEARYTRVTRCSICATSGPLYAVGCLSCVWWGGGMEVSGENCTIITLLESTTKTGMHTSTHARTPPTHPPNAPWSVQYAQSSGCGGVGSCCLAATRKEVTPTSCSFSRVTFSVLVRNCVVWQSHWEMGLDHGAGLVFSEVPVGWGMTTTRLKTGPIEAFPRTHLVEHVRGAVEGLGAEAEGLVHVQDPVQEDGAHLGVEVPLLLDVRLGGVLRLCVCGWVGDGARDGPTAGR